MSARRVNPHRVKTHYSYSASELAVCLGVHKNTVRNWNREGLEPIDNSRPLLFQGAAVRAFLKERRAKAKKPCQPGTIYCVSCRESRRPREAKVHYQAFRSSSGNMRAICEACGTSIFRHIRLVDIERMMPGCDVQISQAPPSLNGQTAPSLNCDFEKEG